MSAAINTAYIPILKTFIKHMAIATYKNGLITLAQNCILKALIPFRKLTYFPPKIDELKKRKPERERAKVIFTFPRPSHKLYTVWEDASISSPIQIINI